MSEEIKNINQKIAFFKRKYYLNLFIRGAILLPAFALGYFLLASLLEYNFWLSRTSRFFIFILFFALVAFCFFQFFWKSTRWWIYKKGLAEEESAKIIGQFFPTISDRLLNVLQLSSLKNKSELLEAGIAQKSHDLQDIKFEKAVDLGENKKYLRYLLVPLAAIFILVFVDSAIFTKGTNRIVRFNQEFSPEAPFQFKLENKNLSAFFNEDFTLQLSLDGKAVPTSCYIVNGTQRLKMENLGNGKFQYTFEKIQNPYDFQIEASGFYSASYKINLINRPELSQLKLLLKYPNYIGKKAEEITNSGLIEIPEGTQIKWTIQAANTSHAQISFASSGKNEQMQIIDNEIFTFQKSFHNPDKYSIILDNSSSKNKDQISYSIDVIKDQYPEIIVENLPDSVLYKSILLGGRAKDDYGISQLVLNYQIKNGSGQGQLQTIKLPTTNRPQQNFVYLWNIDSLKLKPDDELNYFLEVWDNDGVNGRKATRSATYTFNIPGQEILKTKIAEQQETTEKDIDKSLQKAKRLNESISEVKEKLKGKQNLDFQDKKMLEDLVTKKEKLDQAIDHLQQENKLLEQKKDAFTKENERIKEKAEQIKKLMNDLLDEDTKKLFKELEKLLKENVDLPQMQKVLDKMDRKEINIEKELERTLSLFKQLQYDYKFDQSIKDLNSISEKQKELLDKTEKSDKEDSNSLSKEQEELKNESQKLEKSIDDLKKMGDDINKKEENLPSKDDFNELEKSEQESQQSLEQGKKRKSTEHQKKALSKMEKMKKQMEDSQNSMEMEMNEENLESLRQIVHGLIKLSFDQETLMKEYNAILQADPKNIQLSQNQLKLRDDYKVLEDSLLALSKKDASLSSVAGKEMGELNEHIEKVVTNMKERNKANASSEMQLSMTHINNLALMLDFHFNMMMKAMSNPSSAKGKGKKGKSRLNLSKMQQQLNQRIEQLKNGKRSGRQYSEELAKMAAEQARIRKALSEMQDKMKLQGGEGSQFEKDIASKMEQTEGELVNKKITEQTISRQKEIETRLLESEKSFKEKDEDEERKGETAKNYEKEIPHAFQEYLRLREKEVELLKSMPPQLFPFYKNEVTEYFKRL